MAEDGRNRTGEGKGAGWWSAVTALLATLAIVILALFAPLAVDHAAGFVIGEGRSAIFHRANGSVGWAPVLIFQGAVVILVLLIGGPGSRFGWRSPVGRRTWVGPFCLTVAVSTVTALLALVFFPDILAQDLKPIRDLVRASPLWIGFAALAIGAPFSEELLFRGFLVHRLARSPLGFWPGALVANLGWTALHIEYSWLSLADVFLAGLLFSWALWRTRSIWVPISFHAIYNASVFFLFLIPSSSPITAAGS